MRVYAALLLTVVACPALAQQPGVTGMPDTIVAKIDKAFASLNTSTPGCAVGLSRDGKAVLTRAYGMANLEYGVPNTPETIFESGSVAKQFTAAAMVLLAQDGKLSLDDDIRKHVPEVPNFGKTITIRHLLTHTSGLRDQWALLDIKGLGPGTQVHTLSTILDLVAHQKALNFDPGSEYLYSNTGYVLSAIIIQRVSGVPFATFTRDRLFKPLGMMNTQWRDNFRRIVKGRATAYDGNAQAGFTEDMPFTNVHGNGGLLTTVGDLLIWNAFLDAPSAIPGGATMVQTMTAPTTLTTGKHSNYSLGLSVTMLDEMHEISHSGSTAGYRTWLARYPDQRASVAVLCNAGGSANPTALGTASLNAMLGRTPRALVVTAAGTYTVTTADLHRYVGLYRGATPEALTKVELKDGRLVLPLAANRALTAVAADRFRLGNVELVFRLANGKVRDILQISNADTVTLTPVAAAMPIGKKLAEYAGSYWSNELDTRLTLIVRNDTLVLKRRPADEAALRPTFVDGFSSQVGTIVFSRDRRGRVDSFGIWAGRVRNVRFTREK